MKRICKSQSINISVLIQTHMSSQTLLFQKIVNYHIEKKTKQRTTMNDITMYSHNRLNPIKLGFHNYTLFSDTHKI